VGYYKVIRVPGYGPLPAQFLLVGEAPGEVEEEKGRPLVGPAGKLLDNCLSAAGLPRSAAFVTNVCKYRPPHNRIEEWITDNGAKAKRNGLTLQTNGMWHNTQVNEGVLELYEEIERCKPEVIVALGGTPLWALTGNTGISKWRGSELWYGEARLIPVNHPSALFHDMSLRSLLIHDLTTRVMGKMAHPEEGREPAWDFFTGRDGAIDTLHNVYCMLEAGNRWLSVDVETKHGRIDCVGIAWSARDAVCIPIIDTNNNSVWTELGEKDVVNLLRRVLTHENASIIGQNFNYDAQYFERDPAFGFRVVCGHDTKVAQHVLLPGTDKDLVRLSSLYCDWHCYWKDDLKESAVNLDDEKRWRYNCRDAVVTYEVAMKQMPMLRKEGFL
jgi:DNA polymerase